jgi:hypothetical protein
VELRLPRRYGDRAAHPAGISRQTAPDPTFCGGVLAGAAGPPHVPYGVDDQLRLLERNAVATSIDHHELPGSRERGLLCLGGFATWLRHSLRVPASWRAGGERRAPPIGARAAETRQVESGQLIVRLREVEHSELVGSGQ